MRKTFDPYIYGLNSCKRSPPISDNLGLTFWVFAYGRFNCISESVIRFSKLLTRAKWFVMLSFNTSNMNQSTTSRESYTALSLPSMLLSTTFKELSSFFRESLFCLTTATKERKIGKKADRVICFVNTYPLDSIYLVVSIIQPSNNWV